MPGLKTLDVRANPLELHFSKREFEFLTNLSLFRFGTRKKPCSQGYVPQFIGYDKVCVESSLNLQPQTLPNTSSPRLDTYTPISMDLTSEGCDLLCPKSPEACIRYNDEFDTAPLCTVSKDYGQTCQRDANGRSFMCLEGIYGLDTLYLGVLRQTVLFNHVRQLKIPPWIEKIHFFSSSRITFHQDSFITYGNLTTINLSSLYVIDGNFWSPTEVKELHFYGNQLTRLPPQVGKLQKLTSLRLTSNLLSTFPPLQSRNLTELYVVPKTL